MVAEVREGLRPRNGPGCLWNFALSLASLLLALLVCEMGARVLLPRPQTVRLEDTAAADATTYEPRKTEESGHIDTVLLWGGPRGLRIRPNTRAEIRNHTLSHADVVLNINSVGVRYDELGPKAPGEFRVLVLGDSITFGDFVKEEQTLTRRLEGLTRGRRRTIRFINAGLPGVGTMEEFYFYTELKDRVDPDLVLVGMYLNDAVNADRFYARAIPYPFARSRFFSWVASRFQILDAQLFRPTSPGSIDPEWREAFRRERNPTAGNMFQDRGAFDFEIYNAYMDFGLGWYPKAWALIGEMMTVFKKSVDESGRPLAVFLFPVHMQVMGTVEDFEPQEQCRTMCARLGIPFHDLVPPLRSDWQAHHERLFYDHCHYTPYGYGVVAGDVLGWLDAERLIPGD